MSSVYGTRFQYLLESDSSELFRETAGLLCVPSKDSFVYLNSVQHKVERVDLYLVDHEITNPTSQEVDWYLDKLLYKIYLSVPA